MFPQEVPSRSLRGQGSSAPSLGSLLSQFLLPLAGPQSAHGQHQPLPVSLGLVRAFLLGGPSGGNSVPGILGRR